MDDGFRGLRLTDTMSRKKQEVRPLDWRNASIAEGERRVRMYVCGPTVYDDAHIGNARPVIVFDVLFRLLRHLYGDSHVVYARNITDVDDKINARAARDHPDLPLNQAIRRVTEATAAQFHRDVEALGCLAPTVEPRATDHIEAMRRMIDRLVETGHAYLADGHVLFHTSSMPDYGQLSGRSLDEMIAGARVEIAGYKKDPADFVLWKPSEPGEPGWPSPAGLPGLGRPGWHIECSAMSEAHLGPVFDIHGGGLDLIFPHHENELAQSRCALGTDRMAEIWMHNGFLQVEGRKMSKSEGNFVTIREVLETEAVGGRRWPGDVVRLAMLMTHYREPIDFSVNRLQEADDTASAWSRAVENVDASQPTAALLSALLDDLNGSLAIAEMHRLRRADPAALKACAHLLGLRLDGTGSRSSHLRHEGPTSARAVSEEAVRARIAERLDLLKARNFAAADRIRDDLRVFGVELRDGKDAATGERTTDWEWKR